MFNKAWLKLIVFIYTENLVSTQDLTSCIFNEETRDFSIFFKDRKFRVQIGKNEQHVSPTAQISCPENYQHFDQASGECINNACTCDNGRIIHYTKCSENGGENCRSCSAGHERIEVSENVFHCKTPCEINKHRNESGNCVNNECFCENGIPTTSNCSENNSENCETCNEGYQKFMGRCAPVCAENEHLNENLICVQRDCICSNGRVKLNECTEDGSESCESCDSGYKLWYYDGSLKCIPEFYDTFCQTGTSLISKSMIDYKGKCEVGDTIQNVPDWESCRQHCRNNTECLIFVYHKPKRRCFLKNNQCTGIERTYGPPTTSGVKNCCEHFFAGSIPWDTYRPLISTDTGKCECDPTSAHIDEEGICQPNVCQCQDGGLSVTGKGCPVHNGNVCVYSGVFESEHPYIWYFRKWSVKAPSKKFIQLEIESFETYENLDSGQIDSLTIKADDIYYQFGGDDENVNEEFRISKTNTEISTLRKVENSNFLNERMNDWLFSDDREFTDSKGFNLCTDSTVRFEFRGNYGVSYYMIEKYGYKISWEIVDSCQ